MCDDTDPADQCKCPSARPSCDPDPWWDELIAQLPEHYAHAVRLADRDGLTQQRVADRLGLSLSGAKSRIQRGRAMLKGALQQCCRFEFDRRGNLTDFEPQPGRSVCRNCDS